MRGKQREDILTKLYIKRYLHDESGLNRRHIVDNRVHCCFYFINPCGHGLRPIDIEFMKTLQTRVNLVPLIAKADMLMPKEIKKFKKRVLEELGKNQIHIYQVKITVIRMKNVNS